MFKLSITPDTLNELSILVGIFLPLLIAWLIRVNWSKRVKQYVAIGVAVVAAIVLSAVREGIGYDSLDAFIHSVFVIIGVTQTIYLTLWSTIGKRLTERLENAQPPGAETLVNALFHHT